MGFDKISGYENEKTELLNLQKMLKHSKLYEEMGVRIPRGVVLYGEPGVGKTVMARAIACKGINMVELRAADIEGKGDTSIKDIFEKAVKKAPCVLLLDELDKLAGISMRYYREGNEFVNKTLLQELDKLTRDNAVLVVATCNEVCSLGAALLRPGRFDRVIKIDLPNLAARTLILKQYFDAINMDKDFDYEYIAKITEGLSGAALECLANESAIYAFDRDKKSIEVMDIIASLNRQAFNGIEQDPISDKETARKISLHEAGHVVVALTLKPESVLSASIIPQGESSGHMNCSVDINNHLTVSEVEDNVAVALAGVAAEKYALKERCTGASDDIRKATALISRLVTAEAAYGYEVAMIDTDVLQEELSEKAKEYYCNTVKEKLEDQEKRAFEIIEKNMLAFYLIADRLVAKHVLSREEILEIFNKDKKSKVA